MGAGVAELYSSRLYVFALLFYDPGLENALEAFVDDDADYSVLHHFCSELLGLVLLLRLGRSVHFF